VCALEITAKAVRENECGTSEMGSCWYQYSLTDSVGFRITWMWGITRT